MKNLQEYKNEIQNDFNKVIAHNQDFIESFTTDHWFEDWYNNKVKNFQNQKHFFLEDELIYEYPEPITIFIGQEQKQRKIHDFLFYVEDKNIRFHDFLSYNTNSFYTNIVENDFTIENKTLHKGDKFIKAFKFFFKKDSDMLKTCIDRASQIINQNKVIGKLCLSIHPLDYLSISENTNHWTSCHSLKGCYSAGNIQYMCDQATIICYLKEINGDKHISNFPTDVLWNSKIWRTIIYVSNTGAFCIAGRQYPFEHKDLMDKVISCLLNRPINEYHFEDWQNDYNQRPAEIKIREKTLLIDGESFSLEDLFSVSGEPTELYYNDVLYNTKYPSPMYTLSNNSSIKYNSKKIHQAIMQEQVYCPVCAVKNFYNPITCSKKLLCDKCFNKTYPPNKLFNMDFDQCERCGLYTSTPIYSWHDYGCSLYCPDCDQEVKEKNRRPTPDIDF